MVTRRSRSLLPAWACPWEAAPMACTLPGCSALCRGCRDPSSHADGLRAAQSYSLTILELRSPKWVSLGWNHGVGRAGLSGRSGVDPSGPSSFGGQASRPYGLCLQTSRSPRPCLSNLPQTLCFKGS